MVAFATMTHQNRRLSDKILLAFDQACDIGEVDVADHLVRALELTLTRIGGKNSVDKRGDLEAVDNAYERLHKLRDAGGPA